MRRASFSVASRLFLVALYACWSAATLLAQAGAGAITGVVRDQAGAGIPGATIAVTELETNRQRLVASTSDGVYTAPSLAPGSYRLDVQLPGFKSVRRDAVRVSTGETVRIDFELAIGNVSEQVTVEASAPAVRAETAGLGASVERAQVVQL